MGTLSYIRGHVWESNDHGLVHSYGSYEVCTVRALVETNHFVRFVVHSAWSRKHLPTRVALECRTVQNTEMDTENMAYYLEEGLEGLLV